MFSFRKVCLVSISVVALLFCVYGQQPQASTTGDPVKIGILVPLTGPFLLEGTSVIQGLEFYLMQNSNQLGGRRVQLFKEDSEGNPAVGLTKARKLVEKEKVDMIIGPVNSAVSFAIRNYIHTNGVPLLTPVATAEGITKPPHASPYIFRLQVTALQANKPFGAWVVKNTSYRKIAILATDFAPGRDGADAFTSGFEAAGGKIVKALYPKIGEGDYAPYLALLQDSGADAVYGWTAGAASIRFVNQYAEFGLKNKLPLLGYDSLAEEFTLPSTKDAAIGIVTVGPYVAGIKTPENTQFVDAFKKANNNKLPAQSHTKGFLCGMVIDAAIKAAKGDVKDKAGFVKALAAVKLDKTPQGPISFDKNGQVICNIFIARVEKVGAHVENVVIDQIMDTRQP